MKQMKYLVIVILFLLSFINYSFITNAIYAPKIATEHDSTNDLTFRYILSNQKATIDFYS